MESPYYADQERLAQAHKAIINAVSGGSAGRCPFCGAYNHIDFRTSPIDEFGVGDLNMQHSKPHDKNCITIIAYKWLTAHGIKVNIPDGTDCYATVSVD